jgi:hypothetical protein
MTDTHSKKREALDTAHRNFAARKCDAKDLILLVKEGHIEMVHAYTQAGAERAEALQLLERSE